ncbi:MAG TPA: hypothetical protein VEC01_08335 [Noviherbaspirillum sp.]|uniref:hypothetical protein n=1 Tax=Noviherbaspirillum sp. TaxID=1926288 RepID=UPI002D27FE0E|nr:hypothetical protein [Noviherbaspirillum sp.]HYD95319.1 hypothetical protein [Noviherbaspirillum sp.]
MRASDLRQLIGRLEHLRDALREVPANRALPQDDPLVRDASDCELMLPSILTAGSLRETVMRKLNTAAVLLERAIKHEELAPDVQLAADEGYLADEDDLDAAARQSRQERRRADS